MGCTSSTPADSAPASGKSVPMSAMGTRKGVGHTERMGTRTKDRKGIGHTERMGRTGKGAPQAGDLPPGPDLDLACDGQGECAPELDDAGVMTEREVARRTSCSARSKTAELNTADKDSKIKVRYAFWTQRGYYPDGESHVMILSELLFDLLVSRIFPAIVLAAFAPFLSLLMPHFFYTYYYNVTLSTL